MWMRWLFALMIWICAVQAQAGAWPRETGSVFIALSADAEGTQLYAEYGMKGDLTMGMEISMPKDRRLPDVTQFVHYPVWKGKRAILSAGLAVELRETTAASAFAVLKGQSEIAMRAGLFWWRGFATPLGDGWATLDGQVERLYTIDWLGMGQTYKLDAGVGLKPTERLMVTAQAQYWRRGEEDSLRLETGAAWKMGPASLVLSPSMGVIGKRAARVKLGLWLEF
jgi:hypothetical protein